MLWLASVITLLGVTIVNLTLDRPLAELFLGPAAVALFLLARLALGRRGDGILLNLVAFLTGFGLIEIYRISSLYAMRQVMWLAVGLMVMLALFYLVRSTLWVERYKYLLAAAGVALLLLTILFGQEVGGARAWLGVGAWRFEPVEVVKILLVLFLTGYLYEVGPALRKGSRWRLLPEGEYWGPLLLMWGVALVLLILQRDLGAALLLFTLFLLMLYLTTGNFLVVGGGALLAVLGVLAAYLIFRHVRVRVDVWLNPWPVANAQGYQTVQALFAFAAGGLTGRGLGQGFPRFIPAAHTDFILAVVGEELGLLGSLALLLVYVLLVARGWRLAMDLEGLDFLLVAGLTGIFAAQTLLIMGGVVRLAPLTGITLPFVSYGGSSLVSNFAVLGLLEARAAARGSAFAGVPS